uniref:PXA domain-containing protein n=1 Tax=Plectus sambesii TaxID=2011161 RepID=A0A914XIC8_9BILA
MPATHNGWLLLAINGPLAGLIGYVAMHVSFLSGVTCLLALAIGHYLARTVLFGGDHYIDLSGPIVSFIAQKLQGQGETPTSDAPQLTRKRTTASSANSNGRPSTKVPPWQNLKIAEPVNAAIEEFIELTLKTYVNSWYDSEISEDRAFLQEI